MVDFKVRCVKSAGTNFTAGKIYDVVGGLIIYDNGRKSTRRYDSVEDLNGIFASQFELVPNLPRICYILGGEDNPLRIGEKFKTKFGCTCWIDKHGYIHCEETDINVPTLCGLINESEIIREPQFSEDEKALMRLFVEAGKPIFKPDKFSKNIVAWDKDGTHGNGLPEGILSQITERFNAAEYLEGLK